MGCASCPSVCSMYNGSVILLLWNWCFVGFLTNMYTWFFLWPGGGDMCIDSKSVWYYTWTSKSFVLYLYFWIYHEELCILDIWVISYLEVIRSEQWGMLTGFATVEEFWETVSTLQSFLSFEDIVFSRGFHFWFQVVECLPLAKSSWFVLRQQFRF